MNRKQRRAAEKLSRRSTKQGRTGRANALADRSAEIQAQLYQALQLHKSGNLLGAEQAYRRVIELRPDLASAHNALGAALQAQGRHEEALQAYEAALDIEPDFQEARSNRLNLLGLMGRSQELEAQGVKEVSLLSPAGDTDSLFNTANALKARGELHQAAELYTQVIKCDPRHAGAYANLGETYLTLGAYEAAEAMIKASLLFDQDNPDSYNALGSVHVNQGRLNEAIAAFETSLKLRPHNLSVLTNLGNAYKDCRQIPRAIETYREALAIAPKVEIHSNILLAMHYQSSFSREDIYKEHRLWNERYAAPLTPAGLNFLTEPDPDKRLRVGFVSGSFHRHPVGYLTIGALEALNREAVEVVLYSSGARQDDLTQRFKATADRWVPIVGLPDEDFVRRVRSDQIDILIDLAGHSDGFRLLAFARRAAPVQAKWVGGQFNTTGMDAMDYFLSDGIETPEGSEPWYSERIVRLPDGYVCYDPPFYAPDVTPLPALSNGYVTFGCFNYATKITDDVIALWADILKTVSGSRLVLKSKPFNDAGMRQTFLDQFASHGIEPARIDVLESSPHEQLLATYGQIDIALDPFPYSGGLTTIEALWMGVPVITLPGETFAGRHAASHLVNAGLGNWVCDSEEAYLERARHWSRNLDALARLRHRLRDQVARSPLCDSHRFARNFETALRAMWRDWCANQIGAVEQHIEMTH